MTKGASLSRTGLKSPCVKNVTSGFLWMMRAQRKWPAPSVIGRGDRLHKDSWSRKNLVPVKSREQGSEPRLTGVWPPCEFPSTIRFFTSVLNGGLMTALWCRGKRVYVPTFCMKTLRRGEVKGHSQGIRVVRNGAEGRASQTFMGRTSMVQCLRTSLPMQGTWVWSLVWELDPTCHRAAKPVSHSYWACAATPEARAL